MLSTRSDYCLGWLKTEGSSSKERILIKAYNLMYVENPYVLMSCMLSRGKKILLDLLVLLTPAQDIIAHLVNLRSTLLCIR